MKVQAARLLFMGIIDGRNCKAVGTRSQETSRSICRIFRRSKRSSVMSGLPGRKWLRDPRVRVSKKFNPNRREIRVPEYRRGIKDPNTTQWRCGPVRHTAMLVKVLQCLDSTSAKELEGEFLQAVGSDTNL